MFGGGGTFKRVTVFVSSGTLNGENGMQVETWLIQGPFRITSTLTDNQRD